MTARDGHKHVLVATAAQIQRYVFASNRLRYNVGASEAVAEALDWWRNYAERTGHMDLVYVGGGNAVLECSDLAQAKQAVSSWHEWALNTVPGLRVAAVWSTGSAPDFEQRLDSAFRVLSEVVERGDGAAATALPLARRCPLSGEAVATRTTDDKTWVSRSIIGKRNYVRNAETRLNDATRAQRRDMPFPLEFEQLGGHEGESHIAVVHIDGDGVGALIQKLRQGNTGDDYRQAVQTFSKQIDELGYRVLQQLTAAVADNVEALEDANIRARYRRKRALPLRPIVYGGDDLTFVCDARIALEATRICLDAFRSGADGFALTASAGIAITRTKFPFVRAYELSETLLAGAKRARRAQPADEADCWFDVQVISAGFAGDLDDHRRRNAKTASGHCLLNRPYSLSRWQELRGALAELVRGWPQSKRKGLRAALLQGPARARAWLDVCRRSGQVLPELDGIDPETGYSEDGKYTPWFELVELADFFVPFADGVRGAQQPEAVT